MHVDREAGVTEAGEKLYDWDWVAKHQRQPRRARFFDWVPVALILIVVATVHLLER